MSLAKRRLTRIVVTKIIYVWQESDNHLFKKGKRNVQQLFDVIYSINFKNSSQAVQLKEEQW